MRWDWQIGRVAPLERTGARAVDIYDIDGFLTTRGPGAGAPHDLAGEHAAHPRAVCYLDLAWEDYRPDGEPVAGRLPGRGARPGLLRLPAGAVGRRAPRARLKPCSTRASRMCAAKGFDAVEIDDIDSFDPPSTTGFHLTPGDVQNLLAHVDNAHPPAGMTALWKNSGLLAWWGRRYTDGAVVEECYQYDECFSAQLAGSRQFGFACTGLGGRAPVRLGRLHLDRASGWARRSTARTGSCAAPGRRAGRATGSRPSASTVYAPAHGFAAVKLDVDLDGALFRPCPAGR